MFDSPFGLALVFAGAFLIVAVILEAARRRYNRRRLWPTYRPPITRGQAPPDIREP